MFLLRLAVVSGVLIFATACGGNYSSSTPSPSPAPSPTPTPTPSPTPAPGGTASSVAIPVGAASLGTAAFMPDQLNVAVGATVTWTNTDAVAHTSTSDASGWDSGNRRARRALLVVVSDGGNVFLPLRHSPRHGRNDRRSLTCRIRAACLVLEAGSSADRVRSSLRCASRERDRRLASYECGGHDRP